MIISKDNIRKSDFRNKSLTDFQKRVYKQVLKIPLGEVRSYGWVAKRVGFPGAYRAVGNALTCNPYPGPIPCHRVIKSNGSIGSFSKGKNAKRRLLKQEGLTIKGDKVII